TTNIQPLAPFPEQDRPKLELLIGLERNDFVELLYVSPPQKVLRLSVTNERHRAIGIGIMIASGMLDRFHFPAMHDLATLADLAVYIVKHTKKQVSYCGDQTDVTIQATNRRDSISGRRLCAFSRRQARRV